MPGTPAPFILASASVARARLLKDIGLEFKVVPATINERLMAPLDAMGLAESKAMAVSKKHPGCWVIGADQICHLNRHVFHKPVTKENAIHTLRQLQGQTHTLLTAAALVSHGTCVWRGMDTISLTMKPLSKIQIESYVDLDSPLASCGAYCYEKNGQGLFIDVSHPKDSIQGLPMVQLIQAIRDYTTVSLD